MIKLFMVVFFPRHKSKRKMKDTTSKIISGFLFCNLEMKAHVTQEVLEYCTEPSTLAHPSPATGLGTGP